MKERYQPVDRLLHVACVALAWSILLVSYDAYLSSDRSSGSAGMTALMMFMAFGIGAVIILVFPLGLARSVLRDWAWASLWRRLLVGALDGMVFAYLVCIRQRYETITLKERHFAAVVLVVASALAFALAPHLPRLSQLLNIALPIVALTLEALLPMRENPYVHLALDLAAAAGFFAAVRTLPTHLSKRVQVVCLVSAALFAMSPRMIVRASEPVRGLVYDMSTHARVHTLSLRRWLRVKPSKGNRMDFVACPSGTPARCGGYRPNVASALSGSAKGADILMLTVDSMRWDQAKGMPLLKKELGAHLRFDRAVSSAPRTAHSFGSALRGRPLRQTPFDPSLGHPGVTDDATETLGAVLNAHGYRAVHAPTHAFLFPYTSIAKGFEPLIDSTRYDPERGDRKHSVPLPLAIELTLKAAKETQGPMLAWLHAMDTHASYRWDGGKGPNSLEGQLHAARDVDKKLASFLRAYRQARPDRPLVIAVFGDHGEEFGEHGGSYHGSTTFAEQVRVMFWLSIPGVPAASLAVPVSISAVAATLLDLVGIDRPCTFTVPSLLACIERGEGCPSLAVSELLPYGRSKKAVLAGYTGKRYRLLYDRLQDVLRLFDADKDPYETLDLSRVQRAELADMKRLARAWDEQYCVEPDLVR